MNIESALLHRHDTQQWLSFENPVDVICARRQDDVQSLLRTVESLVEAEQLWAVGFVTYEAAAGFDPRLPTHGLPESPFEPLSRRFATLPLLSFALFRQPQVVEAPRADNDSGSQLWRFTQTAQDYKRAIQTIRGLIETGDVYQVNHTTRLQGVVNDPPKLFANVAAGAPFGCYLRGDSHTIVSASPECFFALDGETLYSQPMKGTADRHADSASDQAQRDWLEASVKNRSENLMITDMVRNDLGRVAVPGTVKTSELFATQQYPTVWQMTSRVEAQTQASVADIFTHLFPAASITGAPKRAAMEHIKSLEHSPREIYTGAIGFIAPGRQVQFNVAIRTTWVENATGIARYGAGGGIVWDSDPQEEHCELVSKTQILDGVSASEAFVLFETLGWSAQDGPSNLDLHLARMANSARCFGLAFNQARAKEAVARAVAPEQKNSGSEKFRLRLVLNGQSHFIAELQPAPPMTSGKQLIAVASSAVSSLDPAVTHKTNQRQVYVQAREEVSRKFGKGIEPLLVNERGEVTETDIANLVFVRDGQYYTPPQTSGLLPGVLRESLLRRGEVKEQVLRIQDLAQVEELYLINDLRGWREAHLLQAIDTPLD